MEVVTIFGLQIPLATIDHLTDAACVVGIFMVGWVCGWYFNMVILIEEAGQNE